MNNSIIIQKSINSVQFQTKANSVTVIKVRVRELSAFITPIQLITIEEVE